MFLALQNLFFNGLTNMSTSRIKFFDIESTSSLSKAYVKHDWARNYWPIQMQNGFKDTGLGRIPIGTDTGEFFFYDSISASI